MNLRSFLYAAARLLGDVQAIKKGPTSIVKRLIRKEAHKVAGQIINRTLK